VKLGCKLKPAALSVFRLKILRYPPKGVGEHTAQKRVEEVDIHIQPKAKLVLPN